MDNCLKPGDIFDDKFELLEVLGSGGVGTVYKALQLEGCRLVALKILHQNTAEDDEYRTRFFREAQALSKLLHANIVSVYHLGLTPQSRPYLCMEYLDGQSLRAVLDRVNKLPVLEALRITCDAARALYYTHRAGIIHRDLKPENMILVSVPAPNTLKLVDFGLARLGDQQRNSQTLTKTGELIGSAGYMSPEQCVGKDVDFRTDIYSLSACLYEMMVGKKAMDADSPFGLMYKQLSAPVPIITSGQVDCFHPVLNEIISRGMSKDPESRFASMDEMAGVLDTTISNLQSGVTGSTEILRRLTTGAIAALVLVALALVGTRYWESYSANHARGNSVIITEQERVSQQIVKLRTKVESWKDPDTIKSSSLKERYLKDVFALGRAQLKSSRQQDIIAAEKTYSDALLFCRQAGESLRERRDACLALKAKAELKQGKFDASDSDFNEALKSISAKKDNPDLRRDILSERALLRLHTRRFADALDDFNVATADFVSDTSQVKGVTSRVVRFTTRTQVLDEGGDSRVTTAKVLGHELIEMKPQSAKEAVQMAALADQIATQLLCTCQRKEVVPLLEFSQSLQGKAKRKQA